MSRVLAKKGIIRAIT